MKYGFVFPHGDARTAAEYARAAEKAGWDGFFVWEPVWGIDAWVTLTAAAMRTRRIRLGTMLTPISRMRPWKLAGETVTLDHLSNGRVILAVGLGAIDSGFESFGEVTDRKARAELMDEGLEILTGLWRGQPFTYTGSHYTIKPTDFFPPPPPVQQPRIPIWVVGAWPSEKSMRRALRYDGVLPTVLKPGPDGARQAQQAGPAEVRAIAKYAQANRPPGAPFDIVVEGHTPGRAPRKAAAVVRPWAEAGATWWIEALWDTLSRRDGLKAVLKRIEQGPPDLG
jgi:alkanesulfonate monooxygenase SsuD/methylene tetrahydromethanopterin reductase-like flavin-dependent oxidoreductase (luciferase family)